MLLKNPINFFWQFFFWWFWITQFYHKSKIAEIYFINESLKTRISKRLSLVLRLSPVIIFFPFSIFTKTIPIFSDKTASFLSIFPKRNNFWNYQKNKKYQKRWENSKKKVKKRKREKNQKCVFRRKVNLVLFSHFDVGKLAFLSLFYMIQIITSLPKLIVK